MVKIAEWVRNILVVLGLGFWAASVVIFFFNACIATEVIYVGVFSFIIATFIQIALNEYELRKMGL